MWIDSRSLTSTNRKSTNKRSRMKVGISDLPWFGTSSKARLEAPKMDAACPIDMWYVVLSNLRISKEDLAYVPVKTWDVWESRWIILNAHFLKIIFIDFQCLYPSEHCRLAQQWPGEGRQDPQRQWCEADSGGHQWGPAGDTGGSWVDQVYIIFMI